MELAALEPLAATVAHPCWLEQVVADDMGDDKVAIVWIQNPPVGPGVGCREERQQVEALRPKVVFHPALSLDNWFAA